MKGRLGLPHPPLANCHGGCLSVSASLRASLRRCGTNLLSLPLDAVCRLTSSWMASSLSQSWFNPCLLVSVFVHWWMKILLELLLQYVRLRIWLTASVARTDPSICMLVLITFASPLCFDTPPPTPCQYVRALMSLAFTPVLPHSYPQGHFSHPWMVWSPALLSLKHVSCCACMFFLSVFNATVKCHMPCTFNFTDRPLLSW